MIHAPTVTATYSGCTCGGFCAVGEDRDQALADHLARALTDATFPRVRPVENAE